MQAVSTREELWDEARKRVEAARDKYLDMEKAFIARPAHGAARRLVKFAANNYTSYYYSEPVEKYFLNKAKRRLRPAPAQPVVPKSVLHVMTAAFLTGGHTRIVERWIDSAPDDEEHCVVLIRQRHKNEIPQRLKDVVENKHGALHLFPYWLPKLWKAQKLKNLAAGFDIIVLHQNMTDPVPLMAFGTPDFQRPVILFNHAGHRFWLGRNATDLVIDIIEEQQSITLQKRGIVNSRLVELPYDRKHDASEEHDRSSLRRAIGLDLESSVIVSMASAYKYTPVLEFDFPRMLGDIMQTDRRIQAMIIGVEPGARLGWDGLEKKFGGRIRLLGVIPYEQVGNYLRAADLYIDSFPYNSFTSMLDAVLVGKLPILSLRTPVGTLGFIRHTHGDIPSIGDMVTNAVRLLADKEAAGELYRSISEKAGRMTDASRFQAEIQKAYHDVKRIPKDNSRFTDMSDFISEFDIFSNEIFLNRNS